MIQIALAQSNAEIHRCFPLMQELRPHLIESEFVERVRRQQQAGYQLVRLTDSATVLALAGFRISECLAWGK